MYLTPDADHLSFRDARTNLAALCKADKARVILRFGNPIAILTPIHYLHIAAHQKRPREFAAAKRRFLAALEELRTH